MLGCLSQWTIYKLGLCLHILSKPMPDNLYHYEESYHHEFNSLHLWIILFSVKILDGMTKFA